MSYTPLQKENIRKYLANEFYKNSSDLFMGDYDGRIWKIDNSAFGNFYDPVANYFKWDKSDNYYDDRNGQTLIQFGGWKIGMSTGRFGLTPLKWWYLPINDKEILSRLSCDLNNPDGYGTSCSGNAVPGNNASSSSFSTESQRVEFDTYKNARIFSSFIGGTGNYQYKRPANALPGYYRVSRNTQPGEGGLSDPYALNGFICVNAGEGSVDYAFCLFSKMRKPENFADDIMNNHPNLVKAVYDKLYQTNEIQNTLSLNPSDPDRATGGSNIIAKLKALEPNANLASLIKIEHPSNSNLGKKDSICTIYADACYTDAIKYVKSDTVFGDTSERWCDLAMSSNASNRDRDIVFLSNTTDLKAACNTAYARAKCKIASNRYKSGFTNKNVAFPAPRFNERFSHVGGNKIGFRDMSTIEKYSGSTSCVDECNSAAAGSEMYNACKTGSVSYCFQSNNIVTDACIADTIVYPEVGSLLTQWCKANQKDPNYAKYCVGRNYVAPPAPVVTEPIITPVLTTPKLPPPAPVVTEPIITPVFTTPKLPPPAPVVTEPIITPVFTTPKLPPPAPTLDVVAPIPALPTPPPVFPTEAASELQPLPISDTEMRLLAALSDAVSRNAEPRQPVEQAAQQAAPPQAAQQQAAPPQAAQQQAAQQAAQQQAAPQQAAPPASQDDAKDGLSIGIIILIICAVLAAAVGAVFLIRYLKNKKNTGVTASLAALTSMMSSVRKKRVPSKTTSLSVPSDDATLTSVPLEDVNIPTNVLESDASTAEPTESFANIPVEPTESFADIPAESSASSDEPTESFVDIPAPQQN